MTMVYVLAASVASGAQDGFRDPLDYPADPQTAITTRTFLDVAKAGSRLVAVGARGLIVVSEDNGKHWSQASVPVQSDLLAITFPNEIDGWAVGHDGVILHTSDGGLSWTKQLDGRDAANQFRSFYANAGDDEAMKKAAQEIEANYRAGPALPFLDVWFDDSRRGFVVGSFGLVAATEDGGKTWTPWLHRIENPEALNLNSIQAVAETIFIAGERGMLYALDREQRRFRSVSTGYAGSLFGIVGTGDLLIAYGLRGAAFRSEDEGASWSPLEMPIRATLTSGVLRPDGKGFLIASSAGQILLGNSTGTSFDVITPAHPMRYTAVSLIDGKHLVLTGVEGVRRTELPGEKD